MNEKIKNIIQIIIVFVLIIGSIIFKFIPEYKNNFGSSDKYIDTTGYEDIVEIKINENLNFALIISKDKITNILFFDKNSLCLYNQDIENSKIEESINRIINILKNNDYINNTSTITIMKYQGKYYEQVLTSIKKELNILNIIPIYVEKTTTLQDKGKTLSITEKDDVSILKELEFLSKNIIRNKKYDVSEENNYNDYYEILTETTSKEYTDVVYKKIENYVKKQNVINQDINNNSLQIDLIPANEKGTIYPDTTSWYYVENNQVYAYISITQNKSIYSYCYQGTIDNYKKGQC